MSPRGSPSSVSAPPKPKPCRSLNENATTQGHHAVRLASPPLIRTISCRRVLSAMVADYLERMDFIVLDELG
jgi:hypothetical protein